MSIIKIRESVVQKIMVPVVGLILVTMLVAVFVGFSSGTFSRGGDDEDGQGANVAFVVDGREVNNGFFLTQLAEAKNRMREARQPASAMQMAQLKAMMVDSIVTQELMASAAAKADIRVSGREVKAELDKRVDERVKQYKLAVFGQKGEKKSDAELDAQMQKNIGRGLSSIRAEVEQTFDQETVRAELMMRKYEATVRGRVQISDADLKDSYRTVTVRHILVDNRKRPDAAAKKRADEIAAKLKGGADFAALARQSSDDPGSARDGGLLPPTTRTGPYVKEFLDAAMRLKNPGDISPPVKSPFGYHIIRLDKSEVKLPKDFEKNKEKLRKEQQEQRSQQIWTETMEKIRKDAKLTFKDPEFEGYWVLSQMRNSMTPQPQLLEKAAKAFQEHIRRNPGSDADTSFIQLAQIQQMQGKTKDAIDTLTKGLNTAFEDGGARIILGNLLLQTGKKDEALAQFKEAAETSWDPQVHQQLLDVFTNRLKDAAYAAKSKEIVDAAMKRQQAMMRQNAPPPAKPSKPVAERKEASPAPKPEEGQGDSPTGEPPAPGNTR